MTTALLWVLGVFSGAAVYASADSNQWWHVAFSATLGVLIARLVYVVKTKRDAH